MAREQTTSTGNGFLARWSANVSMIPFIGNMPILNTSLTALLGGLDTLIETGQWLLRGKLASAGTAFAAGTAATLTNSALTASWWLPVNWISGAFTGRSVGTHVRGLTENVVGGVAGVLGQQPTVLRSYPAGIGNIGGQGAQQSRPGYWSSRVAQEQGQDPQRRWQQYVDDSRQGAAAAGRA
jgi:hypothetical protein